MKHLPQLNSHFVENSPDVEDKFDWIDSNYVPAYSIILPQFCHALDNLDIAKYCRSSEFIVNRVIYYFNMTNPRSLTQVAFKNYIRDKKGIISKFLKDEIDSWLDTPINLNAESANYYRRLSSWEFRDSFFQHNRFCRFREHITNYGFYANLVNGNYIPKIVLMLKKSDVNLAKKCFILNQSFPDGMFELWVNPTLTAENKRHLRALSTTIGENNWKVVKYDMKGILAQIDRPIFKSIKHKKQWENTTWEDFCTYQLLPKVAEPVETDNLPW